MARTTPTRTRPSTRLATVLACRCTPGFLVSLPFRTVMSKTHSSLNALFVALIFPVATPMTRTRSPCATNSGGLGYVVSNSSDASEARPLFPRARGGVPARGQSSPGRSTQYLRQPTSAHVAYRRCLLLQRNPSQPGHSFRCSSKSLHFPYIGSRKFQRDSFPLPLFFRFLSQLDLRSPH